MWFSLVTLTTVGYGDRAPLTGAGRVIAGVWMLITLMAVSSITAGLASAFTISLAQINQARFSKPGDLRRASIAVVEGTTSVSWGQYYQARIKEASDLPEAIKRLDAEEVEGVIFDRPALRHHLKQKGDLAHRLAKFHPGLGVLRVRSAGRQPIAAFAQCGADQASEGWESAGHHGFVAHGLSSIAACHDPNEEPCMLDREESGFSLKHGVVLECLEIYGSLAMMSNNGERTKVTDAAAKKVVIVNIWN